LVESGHNLRPLSNCCNYYKPHVAANAETNLMCWWDANCNVATTRGVWLVLPPGTFKCLTLAKETPYSTTWRRAKNTCSHHVSMSDDRIINHTLAASAPCFSKLLTNRHHVP
jgi:hypothetical protein